MLLGPPFHLRCYFSVVLFVIGPGFYLRADARPPGRALNRGESLPFVILSTLLDFQPEPRIILSPQPKKLLDLVWFILCFGPCMVVFARLWFFAFLVLWFYALRAFGSRMVVFP